MLNNQKIFITGGAGFLGKSIIKRFYNDNEITIYSRDEAKHYYIKKQFPNINCIIGDVADLDNLRKSSIGMDVGIFAASLKQIEAVDQNYVVANRTIVEGAMNSRRVVEENLIKKACFISTDKSRAATTLYGSMKFVAGESFIVNAEKYPNINLSTAIYGNVLNSTGSIIPLIWDSINNNYELKLYSKDMTRFMLTVDEAIDVIEVALNYDGYNVIPNAKSFRVSDLFEIYSELFGLKYTVTKPRISEKIHEIMISGEEIPRVVKRNDYYLMHYKNISDNIIKFTDNEFSSKDCALSKNELQKKLEDNKYYKP